MARGRTYRRRRPDGSWSRWYAVIDAPRLHGEHRKQITRTFDTQREAHAWLAEQASDQTPQTRITVELSVAQWLDRWLGAQPFTKPSTLATYRCHVERYLTPWLGELWLSSLSRLKVTSFVSELAEGDLAPATVHRIVATLNSALSAAVREGLVEANPVRGVRLPTVPARPHTVWTVEQASTFLANCGRSPERVLFRLALITGMRRGELLGLTWANVDLPAGYLTVRESRVAIGGEVVTGTPKSRFGVRLIYLDDDTVQALHAWCWTQARCIGPNDGLVFTHTIGTPLQPWWVSRAFARTVADLGLPRIRFHDLRHTSATLGLTAGESLKEVSARLGHSDIAITANVYGEVLPQTAQASVARRAQLLTGTLTKALQAVAS